MYRVLLDQTAFFPEGGGQPADEGTLDGIFVTDVQEIDGEIWHTVEAPLEPGKTVVGKLDFEKRFSNMQNHCGEHIVSGIVHRIYGFNRRQTKPCFEMFRLRSVIRQRKSWKPWITGAKKRSRARCGL